MTERKAISANAPAARRTASELAEVHKAQALIDVAQTLRSLLDEMRKISATLSRMEMRRR